MKEKQFVIFLSSLFFAGLLYHFWEHLQKGSLQGALFLVFALTYVIYISYIVYQDQRSFKKENTSLSKVVDQARLYYDNIPTGLMTLDKNRMIVATNHAMSTIFGYRSEEVINQSVEILHLNKDAFDAFGVVYSGDYLQNQEPIIQEIQMKRKDGSIFWAEVIGIHPNTTEEQQIFAIWSVRDISERVNARALIQSLNTELIDNNRRLSTLLNTVPIPIYFKDADFYYRDCNEAFAKLFKKPKSELIGTNVFAHLPKQVAVEMNERDEQMRTQAIQTFKAPVSFAGESPKSIEYHKAALHQKGVFMGLVGVMLDVTQRDQQEAFLKERIEEEVQKNLAQAEAHQKQELRNTKFASIGKLAAGITHEINTPLTYIKGNFEMLQDDIRTMNCPHKTRMLEDCDSIQNGIDRISHIVEAMREMSQKNRGEKTPTNLYSTLVFALTMAHNRIKQITDVYLQNTRFTIGMDKDAYTFTVLMQPQRIEQVWVIIINNALDELVKLENFEERDLFITIEENTRDVIVSFTDNAGGIPQEILPTLFEPFTSTKESSGIGIGLNIAQQIIEEHNGTIAAYNEAEGATFTITLPKAPAATL